MEQQGPYTHPKKGKQSESAFKIFLQDNSDKVHVEHPNLSNLATMKYLSNNYNQLSATDQQIYASRAASQNQAPAISKKKKPLSKPVEGSQNNSPYISQTNTSNYSSQESSHYSVLPSIQINQYNQQGSQSQRSNNTQQFIKPNYQQITSNRTTTIQPIQTKQNQSVTPKKRITKPIKKTQESESSDSDYEPESSFHSSSSNQQQSKRVKVPSMYSKQSQNQSQNQVLQQNYFYNSSQPQIKQQQQQQPKTKQKATKTATLLPTPYQQNSNIQIHDHRLQFDQIEPSRYYSNNGLISLSNDSYAFPQINQINSQRQTDTNFYHEMEVLLDDESPDAAKEEERARNLLDEFELKSNFYFSMAPSDCNCLSNYPISFIGK